MTDPATCRIEYDGAEVPNQLLGVLADCAALLPCGLPGTLTLDGRLATIRREGDLVVVEPMVRGRHG